MWLAWCPGRRACPFLCPCLKCAIWEGDLKNNSLIVLVGLSIGETGALNFNNIGAVDAKLFLLKQTYKSFLFLSETMDIFCRAGGVQQARQSTHLAEGLNPLGLQWHCNLTAWALTLTDAPSTITSSAPSLSSSRLRDFVSQADT